MRDVVSNTSPLLYLHQLGLIDLLPKLYERVVVPTAVVEELAEGARRGYDVPAPEHLAWVDVHAAPMAVLLPLVTDLGPGERAAIALARTRNSALVASDQSGGAGSSASSATARSRDAGSSRLWEGRHAAIAAPAPPADFGGNSRLATFRRAPEASVWPPEASVSAKFAIRRGPCPMGAPGDMRFTAEIRVGRRARRNEAAPRRLWFSAT